MRPVRLEVEGFTAFRQPTVVEFAGADLFALVGPTGAGKTSIIDALTFALYGSVPRLDDRRAVAPVISQNLTEARVRLDFTVDGETYTAVRVVRATKAGGATTKEARLERGEVVLAGAADEVTDAVTELLGLGFEHFTTCVSLPQGQFARFLHDKPRTRQDLLVRLLDLGLYDGVAAAARQRAALARNRSDVIAGQLDQLAGATPEARSSAAARVAELAALVACLAAERPKLDELTHRAAGEQARADELGGQVELLDGVRAPDGVADLAAAVAAAAAAVQACARTDDEASEALAAAEAHLADVPDRATLVALQHAHRTRADLTATLDKGELADAEALAAVGSATESETAARGERQARAADLECLRVERRAQALVPELAVGAPCPVCGQAVHDLPATGPAPDLDRAERALADAEAACQRAAAALRQATDHRARVDEKLSRMRADLAKVDATLEGAPDPEALDDQLAVVDAAVSALDKARQAERDARAARREAARHHDDLIATEREARRAFDAARDAVAALAPPAVGRSDLAADWSALVAWAAASRPDLVELAGHHRRLAEAARAEGVAVIGKVAQQCSGAGVEVDPAPWPGEAVAAAHARAEEALATIDAQLAEAERLRADQRGSSEQHQVADALAGHLAANRFEKWLLDEAVHQLVAGASGILGELTSGGYALGVDGRSAGFVVIDHTNASQARPARTLSGGETFLASLALALALADQLAGIAACGTARLEALFLDEGFGTLDADTLDVVAAALDELGARGRMVGIVTHVRELAERLPVRFEVRKVGGAATVERVDA
jgi:DNA repair protein SbcC/Rad50